LADEELQIVKNLSASPENRANADFVNVFYNQGNWTVSADATAPSLPQVLTLTTTSPAASTGLSAAMILPGNGDFTDFTLESQIKILAPAPTSTKSGMILRATDAQNYYRLSLESSAIKMEKIQNDVVSTIWTLAQTFSTNTWYKVKVVVTASNFDIYLADSKLATITDSTFTSGKIGFFTANYTKISLDSVNLTAGGTTTTWNFDTATIGEMPPDLARFGLYDLPESAGYLTIANQIADVSTLKHLTVRITWVQEGSTRMVQLETIKNYASK
jgi:hypothetical protein